MTSIVTVYSDGRTETRELTAEEIAQATADATQLVIDAWHRLRIERDALLAASDWTVLSDSPTPTAAWKTYRQVLRDLPANTTDPTAPDWPTPPS